MIYVVENKEELDKKIEEACAAGLLVVIDFFANWCGPCKFIGSKIEELATQYADKAIIMKVNVDDCEEIAMFYNVTSMPTFVFIKDLQVIDVVVGANTEKLVKNLEKYLGEPKPMENAPEVVAPDAAVEEGNPN